MRPLYVMTNSTNRTIRLLNDWLNPSPLNRCICLLLLWLCPVAFALGAELRLTIPKPDVFEPATTGPFFEAVLRLALAKTAPPDEQLNIQYFSTYVGRERLRVLVAKGMPDLMWSSSTPEREEQLEAVKFNLLKGINEYRFLLVRAADLPKFAQVQTLDELRHMSVGAGVHWSDAKIFRDNGFTVVSTWSHYSLFRMLAVGRFDFMARAYNEIEVELQTYATSHFAREPHLIVHYHQPIYFFVNKNNQALAQRIREGLEKAQLDGSYDKLFFSVPEYKQAWEHLQKLDKRILYLKDLPAAEPARLHPGPGQLAPEQNKHSPLPDEP